MPSMKGGMGGRSSTRVSNRKVIAFAIRSFVTIASPQKDKHFQSCTERRLQHDEMRTIGRVILSHSKQDLVSYVGVDYFALEYKRWAGQSSWGVGDWSISGLPEHRVLWGRVRRQLLYLSCKANVRLVLMPVKYSW